MTIPASTPLGPVGFAVAGGAPRARGPVARRRTARLVDVALVVIAFSFVGAVTLTAGLSTRTAVEPALEITAIR